MSYWKDISNKLHWLDDDSFVYLLPPGSAQITNDEASAMQQPTAAQIWKNYQTSAQALLNKSDFVAIRCLKAGVDFPPSWLTYVTSLRAIVNANSGDPTQPLPAIPSYPVGT